MNSETMQQRYRLDRDPYTVRNTFIRSGPRQKLHMFHRSSRIGSAPFRNLPFPSQMQVPRSPGGRGAVCRTREARVIRELPAIVSRTPNPRIPRTAAIFQADTGTRELLGTYARQTLRIIFLSRSFSYFFAERPGAEDWQLEIRMFGVIEGWRIVVLGNCRLIVRIERSRR